MKKPIAKFMFEECLDNLLSIGIWIPDAQGTGTRWVTVEHVLEGYLKQQEEPNETE